MTRSWTNRYLYTHYFRDVTGFSEPSPAPKDTRKKGGNYVLQAEGLSENLPDIYIFSLHTLRRVHLC